jgi:hypothetical protein
MRLLLLAIHLPPSGPFRPPVGDGRGRRYHVEQCYHDAVSHLPMEGRRKLFHDNAARIYRIQSIPER